MVHSRTLLLSCPADGEHARLLENLKQLGLSKTSLCTGACFAVRGGLRLLRLHALHGFKLLHDGLWSFVIFDVANVVRRAAA